MLNERHRFELALLLADAEARASEPDVEVAGAALLMGYVLAEGLTPDRFSDRDRRELAPAYVAAIAAPAAVARGLFSAPPACCTGAHVMRNAGIIFENPFGTG